MTACLLGVKRAVDASPQFLSHGVRDNRSHLLPKKGSELREQACVYARRCGPGWGVTFRDS